MAIVIDNESFFFSIQFRDASLDEIHERFESDLIEKLHVDEMFFDEKHLVRLVGTERQASLTNDSYVVEQHLKQNWIVPFWALNDMLKKLLDTKN